MAKETKKQADKEHPKSQKKGQEDKNRNKGIVGEVQERLGDLRDRIT